MSASIKSTRARPSSTPVAQANDAEIAGLIRAVGVVARDLGLEVPGFRLLANMGEHSGQEVPHYHAHILAGRPLGRMLPPA